MKAWQTPDNPHVQVNAQPVKRAPDGEGGGLSAATGKQERGSAKAGQGDSGRLGNLDYSMDWQEWK